MKQVDEEEKHPSFHKEGRKATQFPHHIFPLTLYSTALGVDNYIYGFHVYESMKMASGIACSQKGCTQHCRLKKKLFSFKPK